MSDTRSKFIGLIVFLILMIGFSYLMITGSKANHKEVYNRILISENRLLPAREYLRYAGLMDSTEYEHLTLTEVKSIIEEHPYLRKAEVEFDGVSTILVEVQEKEIKAVLLQNNELKLLTGEYETLPLFPPAEIRNLPVISNLNVKAKKSFSGQDLQFAFRIIDAISLCDTNMRKNLAEINLRKGSDAILTFTGLQFPVLFGKGEEIEKSLIIRDLWPELIEDDNSGERIEYLDLRYKNKVFIGKRKTELISG